MGGMGVAIGSLVGQELADLFLKYGLKKKLLTKKKTKINYQNHQQKELQVKKILRFFWLLFYGSISLVFRIVLLFKFVPVPFTPLMGMRFRT